MESAALLAGSAEVDTTIAAVEWAKLILHHTHRAPRGTARKRRIGFQRDRDFSRALGGLPGLCALGFHRRAALRQLGLVDGEMDRARGNVDLDPVAVLHQADQAAFG